MAEKQGIRDNIRKRGDKWYALIQYEGETYTPGHGFNAYKTAKAWVIKKKAELQDGITVQSSNITVSEFCDFWLKTHAKYHNSEQSYKANETIIEKFIKPTLGTLKLQRVKKLEIELLQNKVIDMVSPKRAYKVTTVFRGILRRAEEWNYIIKNPSMGIPYPKTHRPNMVIAEIDELKDLIEYADEQSKNILRLAGMCALRRGEILGLEWRFINLKDRTIDIRQQMNINGRITPYPKTKAGYRTVPMIGPVAKGMKEWKLQCGDNRYLWLIKNNLRMGYRDFADNILPKLLKECGIEKNITFQSLRHSCVTYLLKLGTPLPVIKKIVGHKNISTTVDIYGHITDKDTLEEFGRLERFYLEETGKEREQRKNNL